MVSDHSPVFTYNCIIHLWRLGNMYTEGMTENDSKKDKGGRPLPVSKQLMEMSPV